MYVKYDWRNFDISNLFIIIISYKNKTNNLIYHKHPKDNNKVIIDNRGKPPKYEKNDEKKIAKQKMINITK